MIDALPPLSTLPPAAYVAPVLVKKRKGRRGGSAKIVAPAVIVGAWVVLSDGRQCRVSAVLPDGRVYCSEIEQ